MNNASKSQESTPDHTPTLVILNELVDRVRASHIATDSAAERVFIDAVLADPAGSLPKASLRAVLREVVCGLRSTAVAVRVAYLGPPHSYSHLAACERFGENAEYAPVASIGAVFDAVHRGDCAFGLVPMENSTDGRVADTLDCFARRPLRICGEVQLRIHHHLLGNEPRDAIREVYSKPQALSQCRGWLTQQLPAAATVETTSTAEAARVASLQPGVAAIASRQAGAHYGLGVLAESIEDNRNNITRFAVIGGDEPSPTNHDKTSLMFELKHEPGALANATAVFKTFGLNLTWIESFPMPDTPTEYLFFVEFEGHRLDEAARVACEALASETVRLDILGSYPRTTPVD